MVPANKKLSSGALEGNGKRLSISWRTIQRPGESRGELRGREGASLVRNNYSGRKVVSESAQEEKDFIDFPVPADWTEPERSSETAV